jgi:hypothetical protein
MGSGTLWRDPRSAQPDDKDVESLPGSFDVAAFLSGDADGSSSSGKTVPSSSNASGASAVKRLQLDPESRVARLIALIEADQSWLAIDRANDLLKVAGFANELDQINRMIAHQAIQPELAARVLLVELLNDEVIALFPAALQVTIRAAKREGLENLHSALRITDRARVMTELLFRERRTGLIDFRLLDHANETLENLGRLHPTLLQLQAFSHNAANEAIHGGDTTAAA